MKDNEIYIHILNADHSLDKYLDIILRKAEQGVEDVLNKINIKNVDIVISNDKYRSIEEVGIGGKEVNGQSN